MTVQVVSEVLFYGFLFFSFFHVCALQIAVIYFRCGYSPDQYPSELEWSARLTMERSLAIKSPSIHYHLAGTKKVQQQLAFPGVLEKFLDDPGKVEQIRGIFTGLHSLDKEVFV